MSKKKEKKNCTWPKDQRRWCLHMHASVITTHVMSTERAECSTTVFFPCFQLNGCSELNNVAQQFLHIYLSHGYTCITPVVDITTATASILYVHGAEEVKSL